MKSKEMLIFQYFDFSTFNLYSKDDINNKLSSNNLNCDSLIFLSVTGLLNYIPFKNKPDRYDKALKILFGYWVENMYIILHQGHEEEIKNIIGKQIDGINSFYNLKQLIKDTEIIKHIERLQFIYKKVEVIKYEIPSFDSIELEEGSIIDPIILPDEYIINESDLNKIIGEIISIREEMVENLKI